MQKISLISFPKNNNIKFKTHKHNHLQTGLNKTALMQNDSFERKTNKLDISDYEIDILEPETELILLTRNDKFGPKYRNYPNTTNKKNIQAENLIPGMHKVLSREEKEIILEKTGIKSYIQQCIVNDRDIDPEIIRNKLETIAVVKELPFKSKPNGPIKNGRQFLIKINNSLDMTFEVHDYIKDGSTSWVMRLYDNDKKFLRSYLSESGAFKHGGNSYFSKFTHIKCKDKGKNFVLN